MAALKMLGVLGVKCQPELIYSNRFGSQVIFIFPSYLRLVAFLAQGGVKEGFTVKFWDQS